MVRPMFHRIRCFLSHCVFGCALFALAAQASRPYSTDVTRWVEVAVPPESDGLARELWDYAGNYSEDEWRVFARQGRPHATLLYETPIPPEHPEFTPSVGEFKGALAFARVDDGWLVGFNKGESGAALYWFALDGKRNYKISDHQVIQFLRVWDGVYAVEGINHLGYNVGSLIRVTRPNRQSRWRASMVIRLSGRPQTVVITSGQTLIITMFDGVIEADRNLKVRALLKHAPWEGLYPTSSILIDQRKLYVGMRQYVGELDLVTHKLRMLVPSRKFLNKLTKKREQEIRGQH